MRTKKPQPETITYHKVKVGEVREPPRTFNVKVAYHNEPPRTFKVKAAYHNEPPRTFKVKVGVVNPDADRNLTPRALRARARFLKAAGYVRKADGKWKRCK
jgi:hypothetical protein